MGYHIIIKHNSKEIEHVYCEYYHELANYPIQKDSIIYEGEEHWKPSIVSEDRKYESLANYRVRASIKAEQLFLKQALERQYMIEIIDQSPSSFERYYGISNDFIKIKRGDFLIRNVGNLEIEVKCKTIYWENKKPYFFFEKEHLEKHLNMQEFTKTPVILALYERNPEDIESPLSDKLHMVDMNYISKNIIEKDNLKPVERDWGFTYQIPLIKCKKGFDLIEYYKKKQANG